MKLSERIKDSRTDRLDEWSMDELARDVAKLEGELSIAQYSITIKDGQIDLLAGLAVRFMDENKGSLEQLASANKLLQECGLMLNTFYKNIGSYGAKNLSMEVDKQLKGKT